MTIRYSQNPPRARRVAVGCKGFKRLLLEWLEIDRSHYLVGDEIKDLGKMGFWILTRQCAKLTEREATTVLHAIRFDGINYEPDENRFRDAYRKLTSQIELNFKLSKLCQIVTACCELSPAEDDPYYEMYLASVHSSDGVKTVRQALIENVFGLSKTRRDHLRGDAINLLSDRRIPEVEVEWFGANWETAAPFWELLRAERTLTRERIEALLNKSVDTPSSLLGGVL